LFYICLVAVNAMLSSWSLMVDIYAVFNLDFNFTFFDVILEA